VVSSVLLVTRQVSGRSPENQERRGEAARRRGRLRREALVKQLIEREP